MLLYYFKFAFRNLRFHLTFSLINIVVLSIGISSCLLISSYLFQQWSYDTFHSEYDKIYRIHQLRQKADLPRQQSAQTVSGLAEELRHTYPGVEAVCRLHKTSGNIIVQVGEQVFRQENVMGTDQSFFELFDFAFIYGSATSALSMPQAVVLTQTTARKYFGEGNPLGKELIIDGAYGYWGQQGYDDRVSFQVAGVIEDLPDNTHLQLDLLVSFNMYGEKEKELSNWGDAFYTYVKLDNDTNPLELAAQLPQFVQKYSPEQGISLSLQPMHEIHLTSQLVDEIKSNGDEKVLWLLSVVAGLILLLACTNYINFVLAKGMSRQKEVGLRKIFWASSQQLFRQLFTEAFLLNVLALFLALTLIQIASSPLSSMLGLDASEILSKAESWLWMGSLILLSTLISGAYPASHLAKFRPRMMMKNQSVEALSEQNFRKGLIAFQFMVSVFTVGCALVLYGQMDYMQSKDPGMDLDNILLIRGAEQTDEQDSVYLDRIQSFKNELMRLSMVNESSQANFIPGEEIRGQAIGYVRRLDAPETQTADFYFSSFDENFIEQLNMKLLAGSGFNQTQGAGLSAVIISQEASRQLGFSSPEEAIGQQIVYRMNSRPVIIGVVDDFHQLSLQRAFQPIIFELNRSPQSYHYLKLNERAKLSEIHQINQLWEQHFPGSPFSYFFLEDFYARQYQKEVRFSKVITTFAILAILIASLGFFGLSYYTATHKIKEIGIRKTLGASFNDILSLLGKGTVSYLIIPALVALPLIVFFSKKWLSHYAFRIEIAWWMLAFPPALLFSIASLMMIYQSQRTYRLNPVDTLKVE